MDNIWYSSVLVLLEIRALRIFLGESRKKYLDKFGTKMLQYCYSDMLSQRNEKSS